VLLATSMLQVGVDVRRLGLMVVTGQPKNTAEYIQATSRVGRDRERPGLVLMIYQWSRPRDLAHYESFGYDHATFGLGVEGLTTTPFSDRALDRGLTGLLVTTGPAGSGSGCRLAM
jgi:Helicase conserved C-terminal domain